MPWKRRVERVVTPPSRTVWRIDRIDALLDWEGQERPRVARIVHGTAPRTERDERRKKLEAGRCAATMTKIETRTDQQLDESRRWYFVMYQCSTTGLCWRSLTTHVWKYVRKCRAGHFHAMRKLVANTHSALAYCLWRKVYSVTSDQRLSCRLYL